jgi:hypothetical protein
MEVLSRSVGGRAKVCVAKALRMDLSGRVTRFESPGEFSRDGALRLCYPSPLIERNYFDRMIGAWDSVLISADAELLHRIMRFDPGSVAVLDAPVMFQLDSPTGLTRGSDTYADDRGESSVRYAYRQAWLEWHAGLERMPRLDFPLKRRPFEVPDRLKRSYEGAEPVSRSDGSIDGNWQAVPNTLARAGTSP